MKTNYLKTTLVFLILALITAPVFSSSKEDFSKPIKKEFNISKGAVLSINSEFTDIKAINWAKDVISVEVIITVDAKNAEKAKSRFENVTMEIDGNEKQVTIITGLDKTYFGNKKNNNIDIEVLIYYPEHIQLDLNNEFGSNIFENISGIVNVDIAYGSFKAASITNSDVDIDMEFGKINIERIQSGTVDVAYGEFNTTTAGVIKLNSEFSSNEIESIERLDLNSAYDKVYIGNVNNIFANKEFTSLRIDKLGKSLKLVTAYGSIKVNNIASDFELIDVQSEFTGVHLNFPTNPSFAFKASVEMGDIKYPKDLVSITNYEKEMFSLDLEGYFGNAKDDSPKVILSLENASAYIKINE